MRQLFTSFLVAGYLSFPSFVDAKSMTYVTVEEARVEQASQSNAPMVTMYQHVLQEFSPALALAESERQLASVTKYYANVLWQSAKNDLQNNRSFDDRPLYWARLQMATLIRQSSTFRKLPVAKQKKLMFKYELSSRGYDELTFTGKTDKKILITGFDPFFLDRNIEQSNPSGIAAMHLDGKVLKLNGKTVEIQSLMVPVRFADFDMGMIETMLTDSFPQVDMIATISMGRKDFDLERFPGLRRSAKAPGNLNVYTGASATNPLKPFYQDSELRSAEFVEFSLPVAAMQKAQGPYKVIDNHMVETLARGKFAATSLVDLSGETSVQGSGGGYLSNEISYRSIVLRNKLKPSLPVGHIHTPRISTYQKTEVQNIVLQIEEMLRQSIAAI